MKNRVETEDFNLDGIIDKKEFPECQSPNISKQGIRKNKSGSKQKYKCLNCGAYFILDLTKHLKGNARMVCLLLDMYYKGNSLRDIQDTLYKEYKDNTKFYWKLLSEFLFAYADHNDNKYDGGIGDLRRKQIVISDIEHIGKESNNLEESGVIGV